MATDTKRRNGRKAAAPAASKVLSTYHVFQEEGEKLVPLGDVPARNAEDALNNFLKTNKATDKPYVIVPRRNLTRVTVEVDTVTKVRLKSA